MSKPHLVIISDSIRRDLQDPLKYFKKVRITHLYRQANYGDMTQADFKIVDTRQFDSGRDLGRLLEELKPDIIQGPEPFGGKRALLLSFVVWRYSRKTGTPYIFPVLENIPAKAKHGAVLGQIINWWAGVYGRSATKVLYLNQGARANLINAGVPESKLERKLWGNWGIDTGEFSPVSRKFKVESEKFPTVLFVGKISVAKGVPWLIEAIQEVLKQFPEAKLWLAGGKGASFIIPDSSFIKHLGIIKNKDMASLYRKATLVAAPSITTKTWAEQVGNVNLQALSCGTPIVTTNSGAIPEYVKNGQGATIVPEKDSKALATAILALLGNRKTRDYQGKLGRQWILSHYDVRKNIGELDEWLVSLK